MALNGAYEHMKTRRLARALEIPPTAALGIMEAVWGWVRNVAKSGRIEIDQWEDIAEYLQWRKPALELRNLLLEIGFIDRIDDWDWVHDWHQHADDTTRRYLERAGLKFANGAETRTWKTSQGKRVSAVSRQNGEMSRQNGEMSRLPTRARPEPEPEPEPAAARAPERGAREAAAAAAAIAEHIRGATPSEPLPPGKKILRRIVAAMNGASPEELLEWLRCFLKKRQTPVKNYGFWPDVIAEYFGNRTKPPPPPCPDCHGEGFTRLPMPEDFKFADLDSGKYHQPCHCKAGKAWAKKHPPTTERPP